MFSLLLGAVMSFIVMWIRGIFAAESLIAVIGCLGDGFFVTAILLGGLGLLAFCSNEGAFDGVVYSVKSFWHFATTGKHYKKMETYAEYKARKHTSSRPLSSFFWVSLGYLALAIAFTAIYYSLR